MKNTKNRLYKRIISLVLACLMVVSTVPMTSYSAKLEGDTTESAAGGGDKTQGSAGGDDTGGSVVSSGGDFGAVTYGGSIGVRFSIIDPNNPTEVISVLQSGETGIIDMLYTNKSDWAWLYATDTLLTEKNRLSAIKTQPVSTRNECDQWFLDDFTEQMQQIDGETRETAEMARWLQWTNSAFKANGSAFKDWFWTNSAGENVEGVNGAIGIMMNETTSFFSTQGEKVSAKGTSEVNKKQETKKEVAKVNKPQAKVSAKSQQLYTEFSRDITGVYNVTMAIGKATNAKVSNIKSSFMSCMKGVKQQMALQVTYGNLEVSSYASLKSYAEDEEARMDRWAKQNKGKRFKNKILVSSDLGLNQLASNKSVFNSLFGPMTVYAAEETENKTTGTGSTGTETEVDKSVLSDQAHLVKMLRFENADGNKIFRLKDTDGKVKALNDSTIQRKWILVVEPLIYLTIYDRGMNVLHPKVFGTTSNVYDYLDVVGSKQIRNGSLLNRASVQSVTWGALTLGISDGNIINSSSVNANGKTLKLLNDEGKTTFEFYDSKLCGAPSNGAELTFAQLAKIDRAFTNVDGAPSKSDLGVHMYWGMAGLGEDVTASIISSWDNSKFPNAFPGPAPDAKSDKEYPVETEFGDKSKKFNIVKFYYTEQGYEGESLEPLREVLVDVQTRKDTPHSVVVKNEGDLDSEYFWEVEKWATGKKSVYPETGDKSRHFEDYVKSNVGEQAGLGVNVVDVKPEDGDEVLYIKLKMATIEKGDIKVVKVYESDGVTDKVDVEENPEITEDKYNIATEDGEYTYKKYIKDEETLGTHPESWADVPTGTEETGTTVDVGEDIHTIYIKYEKSSSIAGNPITLHEDELSYPYSMNSIKTSLDEIWFNFPDKHKDGSGSHGDDDDRWHCSWSRVIEDSNYSMSLRNSFDYGATNIIGSQGVFIGSEGGKVSTSNSEIGASLGEFDTEKLVPNWMFTLYRNKVKDKVTLYPDKNSQEVVNNMSLIGVDGISYIPSGRVAKENGGSFKDAFSIKYAYDTIDKQLSYKSSGCSGHGDSGSYDGEEKLYIDTLNNSYSGENVITKYYLGKKNDGSIAPDITAAPFTFSGRTYKSFLNTKSQKHTVKFYPMLKMSYQTQTTGEEAVYVTSTNESSVLTPTRVEAGVYRDSAKPGLLMESTQWSTHAKVHTFLNSKSMVDKNSVLPGGAMYTLKANNKAGAGASDNWVGVHTYQVCIPDESVGKLTTADGVISESVARKQLEEFKVQTESVLSKYQVVQWVTKGIQKNESEFKEASPVLVSGAGQVSKFGDNTLDRSSKYYLKVDGDGTSRADLDIVDKKQEQTVWTLTSNTDGVVTVKNDKGLTVSINKEQGIEGLTGNAEVKVLDDKTKIVTNFVSALDRNKGSNRENSKWYNEAFEDIKVIENYSAYKLGFGDGQDTRSSVLDTKLTGKLEERRDLYNFDESTLVEKTRTSQFKTSAKSTEASVSGKAPGYIGSLDGLDIVIPNIENLMTSKLFHIPNANVTDLN